MSFARLVGQADQVLESRSRQEQEPVIGDIAQHYSALTTALNSLAEAGLPSHLFVQGSAVSNRVLHRVVPAARQLGAALLEWWALPKQAGPLRLEAAQAAAARSCAYLRCANLAADGGPAAGQGVGSMRCR